MTRPILTPGRRRVQLQVANSSVVYAKADAIDAT